MAFIITVTLHRSERDLGAVESPKILLCCALFSGLFVADSLWGHRNHNFVGACHSNCFERNWALSWTKVWCELNLIFVFVQEQGRAYGGLACQVQVRKLKSKCLSLHYGRLKPIVLCIGLTSECLCCSVNLPTTLCFLQHAIQLFIDTDHSKLQNIPFTVWQFAWLSLVANGHVKSIAIKICFCPSIVAQRWIAPDWLWSL